MTKQGSKVPLESIEATALHEAAHVICALAVGLEIGHVTIKAEEGRLGHFMRGSLLGHDVNDVAAVYAAGLAAEELWCTGQAGEHGAANDLHFIEKLGTGTEFLAEARSRALALCTQYERAIRELADRLLKQWTLSADECKAVFAAHKVHVS